MEVETAHNFDIWMQEHISNKKMSYLWVVNMIAVKKEKGIKLWMRQEPIDRFVSRKVCHGVGHPQEVSSTLCHVKEGGQDFIGKR